MKLHLFHVIGENGEESALVRRFIVNNSLSDLIEFTNLDSESARMNLFEASGSRGDDGPVLLANGIPIRGRVAILDWLRENLLRMRD